MYQRLSNNFYKHLVSLKYPHCIGAYVQPHITVTSGRHFVAECGPVHLGYLATFLALIHKTPVAHHRKTCNNQKCLQTLPNIPLGKAMPS